MNTILENCNGLLTIVDPVIATGDIDKGPIIQNLASCMNVVISDSNKVEVTKGTTKLFNLTNGHSLFCDGGVCLVCQGGTLYEVNINLTLSSSKRSGMSGNKIDYAQYGDAIYFGNRNEHGVYYNGAALSWDVDTYTGPLTDRYFE